MEMLNELRDLIERHCDAPRWPTAIPSVTLMRANAPTVPVGSLHQPSLCIVAQGRKRVMLGEKRFEYDSAKYLIGSVDLPISAEVCEASEQTPYLAMRIGLDPATLAAMLLDMPESADEGKPLAGLAVSPLTADLLDPVLRLVRLLDRPRDIAILAPLAEREILYRLMLGPQGAMLRQIALRDSRLSQINRAIKWIKENYERPFRIETLAAVANMSPSSFHRHFKAVTAMSPLQFQKLIRLQEARRRVLAQQDDAASVGFAVGYESPSQFSREYSRLFGAPPGRDAARLRAAAVDSAELTQAV
ncbi:AraC family transcriptional regulator [Methylocapsa sp. S129]|uniref:AraC family transcriptional regulator n=1 Tax=Methylocapsa sp. S129 TaxID=1641869 RepID=UPI00131C8AAD|nr:AraC family transcriptional regulator [Methylocapsa sp. S129]